MNGRSGSLSSRPSELHSSGTVSTQARHALRISVARSIGQKKQPA